MSSRDPESIAREETYKEKRRDGKTNYVNRDTPQQGNTIYVHGYGVNEHVLRTGFSLFGNIMNINSESEKKYVLQKLSENMIKYSIVLMFAILVVVLSHLTLSILQIKPLKK